MKKYSWLIVLASVGVIASCSKMSCSKSPTGGQDQSAAPGATPDDKPDYSGITVERVITRDVEPGKGQAVKEGDTLVGRYGAWIYDPKKLANKGAHWGGTEGTDTFKFTVGKGEVVKGWEQGVIGMKEGGKRSIIVPVSLGYGDKGADNVPPGSILLIEYELTDIK